MELDTTQLNQETSSIVAEAQAMEIKNDATYVSSGEGLKKIKTVRKRITDFIGPMKKSTHEAWKKVVASEKGLLAPLDTAEGIIKRKMVSWDQEQEKSRRDEQRRLDEEARKLAEEEQLKEAEAAEARGDNEEADEILNAEVEVAPVILPEATPKVAGISKRKNWKARVVNAAQVPEEYKTVDLQKLNAVARATKGTLKIPGVEIYCEESIAAGMV